MNDALIKAAQLATEIERDYGIDVTSIKKMGNRFVYVEMEDFDYHMPPHRSPNSGQVGSACLKELYDTMVDVVADSDSLHPFREYVVKCDGSNNYSETMATNRLIADIHFRLEPDLGGFPDLTIRFIIRKP